MGYTNTSISCLEPYLKIEKIHNNYENFIPTKPCGPSIISPLKMLQKQSLEKEHEGSESEENLFGTNTLDTKSLLNNTYREDENSPNNR